MAIAYALGTPSRVKETIGAFLNAPDLYPPNVKSAIERLATYPAMTNLWRDRIPAEPPDMEADIIGMAIIAYNRALSLLPPMPRKKAAVAEYLKQHDIVPVSFAMIAEAASFVRDLLESVPSSGRSSWPEKSPTGSTFEEAVKAIQDIVETGRRFDSEARAIEAELNFPKPPRRRGAIKAQRTYFGHIMSDYLVSIYGQPCDPMVNILEDVVFDLRGDIEEGTARSRRRGR